ncbi:MAG: DUF86 domain-containing protein [Bacillota bacterium]
MPKAEFLADAFKTGATESYLRRSLEAIFDIGRHILAKTACLDLAAEYKAIARGLMENKIVDDALGERLLKMAGYRNRMVHLYSEVTDEELYGILVNDLEDISRFVTQVREFLARHDRS